MLESLIYLLVVLCIVGIIYWAVQQIPLPPPLKVVGNVVVAIVAIVLLLGVLGVVPGFPHGGWRLR